MAVEMADGHRLAPTWADEPRPESGVSGRKGTAKAPAYTMVGVIAWFVVSVTMLGYFSTLSDQKLDLARSHAGLDALVFRPDGWDRAIFGLSTILAIIVLHLRIEWTTKLTVLSLLFAAMVGGSAMAMSGYDVMAGDQVLIHSPLPWRRDVRFALADAQVTAKGCQYWHTKSGAHHRIIFQVQGGLNRAEVVNLGDAADRSLPAWLAAMRDYDIGVLRLPTVAGANPDINPECMQFWLADLNPQQQAEFNHLLS